MTLKEALKQLTALGNAKVRAQNARSGAGDNQFGVSLGDIRVLANKIRTNHELALSLWETGNVDTQFLATLLIQPKKLSAGEMDRMVRFVAFVRVADWLNAYVVRQHPDKEPLRRNGMAADDRWAARAGWDLTAERVAKSGDSTPYWRQTAGTQVSSRPITACSRGRPGAMMSRRGRSGTLDGRYKVRTNVSMNIRRPVMSRSWLLILATGVFVGCSACHHARIETAAKPSTITIEQPFASGWLFGLVPPKLVSTAGKCQHGLARVETQITFVNGVVRCLTLGIYTPMWIKVTCAEPGVARALTPVPDILVGRGASEEEVARALQRAAQMALEDNRPVLVRF